MSARCPDCGRFARYDAYYVRFRCDRCDRDVPVNPYAYRADNGKLRAEPVNPRDVALLGGEPSL